MGLEQKTVHEIVSDSVKGTFNIPEFQRGFVWQSDQIRDLVDSLYRDYPIGAMLVWDASGYDTPQTAEGAQTLQWVVDGQQRTTALCVAFGSKPYWWPDHVTWNNQIERVDVLAHLDESGSQVEFALANPVRRRDPNWVSVRDILHCQKNEDVTALALKVAAARKIELTSSAFSHTLSVLNRVWAIRERTIPVITVQQDLEDVAEIFARLNQGGTRVTEADVTVALVAAANPGWVRDEFLSYASDLDASGYDLDPGVYIRTITGIAEGTARLKDVGTVFWKDEVRQVWPEVTTSVNEVVHLLRDRGILSSQLLPSRNSLIPLFTFHSRFGKTVSFDRAFRWFLLANADGRYSGAATTALTQDLAAIHTAPTATAALEELATRLRVSQIIDPTRFLEDYSRDRFGRLLLYLLLFDHRAQDWVSHVRIGYDKTSSSVNEGFLPEWHHVFPRAVLKHAGRDENDANVLANITVLNDATNKNRLRAKTPAHYVQEFSISPDDLARHFVAGGLLGSVAEYDDFVTDRAERLAKAANAYLQRLQEA